MAEEILISTGTKTEQCKVPNKVVNLNGVTITTIATVWTPASGLRFRLLGGSISVSAAVSVLFEDNTAGVTVLRTPKLVQDTPFNFDLGNGVLSGAADRVLKATGSAAATITGFLYGVEE
jgi:hypothetical protein